MDLRRRTRRLRAIPEPETLLADEGSVTPLTIGFATIALTLIFLGVIITDLHLAQRRLMSLADSAALAAADDFSPRRSAEPGIELSDTGVRRAAGDYLERLPETQRRRAAVARGTGSPDGRSAIVVLTTSHKPVLLSPFVPRGIALRAESSVRGSLRGP